MLWPSDGELLGDLPYLSNSKKASEVSVKMVGGRIILGLEAM